MQCCLYLLGLCFIISVLCEITLISQHSNRAGAKGEIWGGGGGDRTEQVEAPN